MVKRTVLYSAILALLIQGTAGTSTLDDLSKDMTSLVSKVNPSVVQINVQRDLGLPQNTFPIKTLKAVGSGFVIDRNGYILTSANVVENASDIKVEFSDGTEADAKLAGSDDVTNVAVIKVERTGLRALELGDSDQLQPGTLVVTMNSQSGMLNSVSLGVVAGVNRKTDVASKGLIQISGTVGPGASGGPVLDTTGRVAGITTAMFAPTQSALPFNMPNIFITPSGSDYGSSLQKLQDELAEMETRFSPNHPQILGKKRVIEQRQKQGTTKRTFQSQQFLDMAERSKLLENLQSLPTLGAEALRNTVTTSGSSSFAVPINTIKPIIDNLKSGKAIERAWLGVQLQEKNGIVVTEVESDGPAAKAGVKVLDIIVKANGRSFGSSSELINYILSLKPGDRVKLNINRDGKDVEATATLGVRPAEPAKSMGSKSTSASSLVKKLNVQRPVDLEDANIQQVAKSLSDAYGKNIVVVEPEKITKKVTIHLKSAELEKVLGTVCSALGCQYTKDGETYVIKPK